MGFKVVLVGCGNLGSRHLQAIKKTQRDISVTVCEPYETARNIALERYSQIEENLHINDFRIIEDYHSLGADYDLAIIATNANIRYEIGEWLIKNAGIRYLILEKVLFQTIKELESFKALLTDYNVKAWVNCPRRMYDFYKKLNSELKGEDHIDMQLTGGNWGMACNTIHLLDIYAYITDFTNCQYDITGLEEQIADSKRSGYKEFFGILKFKTERGELTLICDHEDSPIEIRISTPSKNITTEEAKIIQYQSNLTNLAIEQIMDTGECELTTYNKSSELHKIVLKCFLEHINKFSDEEVYRCPIT